MSQQNHDTIAMVAIDASGTIAAGASSNGASHKVGPCHSSPPQVRSQHEM